MADRTRSVDELLAAATAALGVTLAAPRNLGGNDQSIVLRCLLQDGGSVIVKAYQDGGVGRECFAAEAAGLTLTGGTGLGPRLLVASRAERLIVMTDLGSWPSLADVLLGDSADAAEEALLSWVRACGELAVATVGREPDLARLLPAYRTRPAPGPAERWPSRRIGEIPWLLASLSIPAPPGLSRELAEVASILDQPWYDVFSPGDICPDNNLLTTGGVRFVDYERAGFHPAFLDAAYLRMPFSTCWCVFRLPDGMAARAERVYRELVSEVHPELAGDDVWLPGVRLAVAAWSSHAMTYLLDRSLIADMSMIDDGREAPTKRQLLRYRWQQLIAELESADGAAGEPELPALGALARQLLARTEHWQVAELPLYPAFR
jgi:hypothetical protein